MLESTPFERKLTDLIKLRQQVIMSEPAHPIDTILPIILNDMGITLSGLVAKGVTEMPNPISSSCLDTIKEILVAHSHPKAGQIASLTLSTQSTYVRCHLFNDANVEVITLTWYDPAQTFIGY